MKARIVKFDIARTFAILCVVFCHALEAIYSFSQVGWNTGSLFVRFAMTAGLAIGRLGVPIFLFLTGALILKKQIEDDDDVVAFYKKNLIPLLIVNAVWVIIYNIFLMFFNVDFSIESVIRELFFCRMIPLPNSWYMPMIIGVYLGIPFVAKIVKSFSTRVILPVVLVVLFFSSLLPTLLKILSFFGLESGVTTLDLGFTGGLYGAYIVIGYYMSCQRRRKKIIYPIFVGLISFILLCFVTAISYSGWNASGVSFSIWYDSFFLIATAICIFDLLMRIDDESVNQKIARSCTYISRASLAIFFTHVIFIKIIEKYFLPSIIAPAQVLLLFVAATIFSTLFVFIFSKSKICKKYLLLMK